MYRRRALKPNRQVTATARLLVAAGLGVLCAMPVMAAPGDFPHWDEQACSTCHGEGIPAAIENVDDEVMCTKCHGASDTTSCRHPSNVAIGSSGSVSIPEAYKSSIRAGRLVCTTCHDPLVQCQGDKLAPYLNPRFLRGGPFQQADEVCQLCHDGTYYAKLNPHAQLDGTGKRREACAFCHEATSAQVSASTGFRIEASRQCLGCHAVAPHPMSMIPGSGIDSWNHLVVPGESTARQMDATRARTGARLPVAPDTGEITCATCHDPHEAGVIAGDPQYLERARLRPVARCENCHEK